MAAPSEEKLICDIFNLEALTVNQVKSFKALADEKDVFIGTKTGSGIFAYISSITCAPCKTSSDWIRVLVAVTNEILKRESSKCILDPPRVEGKGDPNRNPWLAKMGNRKHTYFFFGLRQTASDSVEILKTDVIVFIGNVIMCLTSH